VQWRGWLDLERLDGVGCLEFDEESALLEDAKFREQVCIHCQKKDQKLSLNGMNR